MAEFMIETSLEKKKIKNAFLKGSFDFNDSSLPDLSKTPNPKKGGWTRFAPSMMNKRASMQREPVNTDIDFGHESIYSE